MKLLIITPYYYPEVGGMENYVRNLVNLLTNRFNWEIVIVTSNSSSYSLKQVLGKTTIYRLPIQFKISNTPVNFRWLLSIRSIILAEKPHIINAHSPVPFIADISFLVKGKIPYVFTYHAGSMKKGNKAIDILISFYEKYILSGLVKNSSAVICYYPEFIKKLVEVNLHNMFVVPPGVDSSIFYPRLIKKNSHKILYVGKVDTSAEWKGLAVLIKSISLLKETISDVGLTVVGKGNAIELYRESTHKLNISNRVNFIGELTGNKLAEEYSRHSVLVLPSTRDAESYGMVLLEAMACGVIAIASRIGGIKNVIQSGYNGILFTPGDHESLAKTIESVFENKQFTNTIKKNALKFALSQSWEKRGEIYNEILYKTYEKIYE